MTAPTWGHCEECGDLASIKPVDGDWLCPDCRPSKHEAQP